MTAVGGGFDLIDHHGRAVTDASFHGRHVLLFFGFSHCRVVCPRVLARISAALDLLGARADAIQPLYASVDPERDTPERLRRFLEADHPRFLGLTGPRAAIDALKTAYRVFAARRDDPDAPDGYVVPHTAFTFLLDTQGRYLAHFADSGTPETLAAAIAAALDGEGRAIPSSA